jgi:hypothetical protein
LKRGIATLVLFTCGAQLLTGAADAKRAAARAGQPRRSAVVVSPGWPLERAQRAVIVHPVRTSAHATTATFVPPIAFNAATIAPASGPTRDEIVWEDGETLSKDDDWIEFTLGCGASGRRLWLQIQSGKVQFDWAEVVFDNGDALVVDFAEKTHGPGLYSLFDAVRGRNVDHVRVIARARSDEAKVEVQMQKG